MSGVSYIVANDKEFRDAITAASAIIADFRIPFTLILRDFYKSEQAIFKLKGPGLYPDFKGEKDKTGKTAYQKYKIRKHGFDYPLLAATGKLAASMLSPSAPGSVSSITPLTLIFGTAIKYGIYHQSDEPRAKIPLRKFVFIGPEAPRFATSEQMGRLERWVGYIDDHVVKALLRAADHG